MKQTTILSKHLVWMVVMLVAVLAASCGSSSNNAQKKAEQALMKQRVQQMVSDGQLTVLVDQRNHKLTIKGQTAVVNLPYVGDGSDVGYGASGFKSLNFTAPITEYEVSYPKGDKKAVVNMKVYNGEDTYDIHVELFYTSKAYIDVTPRGRKQQSYSGVIVM